MRYLLIAKKPDSLGYFNEGLYIGFAGRKLVKHFN